MNRVDVVIIGGGPGGLSCAATLAGSGANVVLLERSKNIGRKVCAGGITWHGLIRRVPENLIQRTFPEQYIYSNWQKICFRKQDPIIATVNREELGRWMMEQAAGKGALIRCGCRVTSIGENALSAIDEQGKSFRLRFDHLVGADGSTSLVRRHLGIPSRRMGIGINCQVSGTYRQMEWHLDTKLFASGYAWIFPHRDSVSIGAYALRGAVRPDRLKQNLCLWAAKRGFDLTGVPARAELINFDHRGWRFGCTWLVGDAAGLASGLTGEGINPAIVSGEEVARTIIKPAYSSTRLASMVHKQQRHARMITLATRHRRICTLLMESVVFFLRLGVIDFQKGLSM